MRASGAHRIEWDDIPAPVRLAIEHDLGSDVVEAVNQRGGFSPGLAARCRLADGGRVFVKAVSPDQNVQACRIHRREAEVASALPSDLPAPALRTVIDDGHWVALVFEEVDGRQPDEPWTLDDLDVVIPAVTTFTSSVTPSPVDGLQTVGDRHRAVFDGWRRLAAGDGDPSSLPEWVRDRIDRLADLESQWEAPAEGDSLLHTDLRADNMLLRDDDSIVFVDWPWACTGAAFVDLLFMLPSIGLGAGPSPGLVVERYGLFAAVDPDGLRSVAVALAGFFTRASLDPPPPGLPTVRSFQRAQADVALEWLRPSLA